MLTNEAAVEMTMIADRPWRPWSHRSGYIHNAAQSGLSCLSRVGWPTFAEERAIVFIFLEKRRDGSGHMSKQYKNKPKGNATITISTLAPARPGESRRVCLACAYHQNTLPQSPPYTDSKKGKSTFEVMGWADLTSSLHDVAAATGPKVPRAIF